MQKAKTSGNDIKKQLRDHHTMLMYGEEVNKCDGEF
jgi:hypothetical protein